MNGKPSSPVLRGLGASDGARLLDPWDYFRVTRQTRIGFGTFGAIRNVNSFYKRAYRGRHVRASSAQEGAGRR
jgi:hypothetical protein